MKKLMTMLAAVAMAFGLSAADSGFKAGSSFEATTAGGCSTGEYTAGQELANGVDWTIPAENAKATVKAGVSRATDRPLQYQGSSATQAQYLEVATTLGNPIALNVPTEAQSINEGLYFDGLVNMTVFDKGDEPVAENAKLAVYLQLKGDDEADGTNFIVRAGGANGATNYDVADADVTPGWHRLTVKAISNIYKTGAAQACPGFVVFVDGTAVNYVNTQTKLLDKGIVAADLTIAATEWNKNGKLFPSLQSGTQDATMIYSVAFDGKGQVDDLAVTATAPSFAEDEDGYYVSFDDKTIASITIGTETFTTSPAMIIGLPTADVTVTYVGKDDYMGGTKTLTQASIKSGETIDLNVTPDLAAAKIGDVRFKLLSDAVDYANATNENCTLTLVQNATEAIAIENVNSAEITIDLNGKSVTISSDENAIDAMGTVFVTGEGTVNNSNTEGLAVYGATILSGTINGKADGCTIPADSTAKFLVEANNDGGVCTLTPPAGKVFVSDGQDPAYWVLVDAVTVTFVDEKVTAPDAQKIAKGAKATKPEDPEFAGFTFEGWFAEAAEAAFDFDNTAITADITLTAHWTQDLPQENDFTITWSGDGIKEVNYTIGDATYAPATSGTAIMVPAGKTVMVAVILTDWYKLDQTLAESYDPTVTATLTLSATKINPETDPITPADVGIDTGAFKDAGSADVKKVVGWAESNGITLTQVKAINFDEKGDPTGDAEAVAAGEAYLLGCSLTELDDAKAAFKFESFDPSNPPTIDGAFNGTVEVKAFEDAACTVNVPEPSEEQALFYKAFLRYIPANKE